MISVPAYHKTITFTELSDPDDLHSPFSEKTFSLMTRNNLVDERDLAVSGWAIETYVTHQFGVDPTKCEIHRDNAAMGWRVSWRMIVAENIDQYEYLFDKREFIAN